MDDRFEIAVDGVPEPGDYATRDEAEAASGKARASHLGKSVTVRPKRDGGDANKPASPPTNPSIPAGPPT